MRAHHLKETEAIGIGQRRDGQRAGTRDLLAQERGNGISRAVLL